MRRNLLMGTAVLCLQCGGSAGRDSADDGRATDAEAGTFSRGGGSYAEISGACGSGQGDCNSTPAVEYDRPPAWQCYGGCQDDVPRPEPLPRPRCPESEPALDERCAEAGLLCSYGTSPTPHCRRYYKCEAETWIPDPAIYDQNYPCEELPSGYCPQEPAHETACTTAAFGLIPCEYDALACYCVANTIEPIPGATGVWKCYGPPADAACPRVLPNIGEGCATQGVECNYTPYLCDAPPYSTVFCYQGEWEEGTGAVGCPG